VDGHLFALPRLAGARTGNPAPLDDLQGEAMMGDDLDRRRSKIRERQLLLALEQWGPAYVGNITDATPEEKAWLEQYVAKNGLPDATAREWHEVRRAQGREANAAAMTAFAAGDYDRASDLIDDARAYGGLFEAEWLRLHEFIAAAQR
jgi:hypothetical protein